MPLNQSLIINSHNFIIQLIIPEMVIWSTREQTQNNLTSEVKINHVMTKNYLAQAQAISFDNNK